MLVILTYLIIGILIFAKYEDFNPYGKVIFGFVFPLHWTVGQWITASIKFKSESIFDNEPLLIGILALCLLLLACG